MADFAFSFLVCIGKRWLVQNWLLNRFGKWKSCLKKYSFCIIFKCPSPASHTSDRSPPPAFQDGGFWNILKCTDISFLLLLKINRFNICYFISNRNRTLPLSKSHLILCSTLDNERRIKKNTEGSASWKTPHVWRDVSSDSWGQFWWVGVEGSLFYFVGLMNMRVVDLFFRFKTRREG